ncbi:YveK family protein [Niallia oryzisoli]|uniref:YveK family protein n=1 Tax=Niallia oryzisoli TaxID=1737571 RepID=UPI00373586A6
MDDKIDLKTFLRIVKKRIFTIIVTVLCASVLMSIYSFYFYKPTYEASESILIGKLSKSPDTYLTAQDTNMLLASTIDFIKNPVVLNAVQKELDIKDDELDEKIAVQNNKDSQIISIVVRDHDKKYTKDVAYTTGLILVKKMNEVFGVSDIGLLGEAGQTQVEKVGSLPLNLAISLVVSLFLGVILAMIREYWDEPGINGHNSTNRIGSRKNRRNISV